MKLFGAGHDFSSEDIIFSSDPLCLLVKHLLPFKYVYWWKNYRLWIWWCRLDQSSSIVDIKIESQELEKFSTINRFAKFHVKAHQSTADPTSTVQTTIPQRYVTALPLPRTLPEGLDCLSLWSLMKVIPPLTPAWLFCIMFWIHPSWNG